MSSGLSLIRISPFLLSVIEATCVPMLSMSTFCFISLSMPEYVSPFSGLTAIESERSLLGIFGFCPRDLPVVLIGALFLVTFVQPWVSCPWCGVPVSTSIFLAGSCCVFSCALACEAYEGLLAGCVFFSVLMSSSCLDAQALSSSQIFRMASWFVRLATPWSLVLPLIAAFSAS